MADIFISYSKAERDLTVALARDLESQGFTVWWDTSLLPGDDFPDEIKRQIDAACVAIVIWSESSVGSRWVKAEAQRADDLRKLITVHTSGLDPRTIPMPYNVIQSVDLSERAKIYAALEKRGVKRARGRTAEEVQVLRKLLGVADIAECEVTGGGAQAAHTDEAGAKAEEQPRRPSAFRAHMQRLFGYVPPRERDEEFYKTPFVWQYIATIEDGSFFALFITFVAWIVYSFVLYLTGLKGENLSLLGAMFWSLWMLLLTAIFWGVAIGIFVIIIATIRGAFVLFIREVRVDNFMDHFIIKILEPLLAVLWITPVCLFVGGALSSEAHFNNIVSVIASSLIAGSGYALARGFIKFVRPSAQLLS
jgi:hypothetical protein